MRIQSEPERLNRTLRFLERTTYHVAQPVPAASSSGNALTCCIFQRNPGFQIYMNKPAEGCDLMGK